MTDRLPQNEKGQSYVGQILGRDSDGFVRKVLVDGHGRLVTSSAISDRIAEGVAGVVTHIFRNVGAGDSRYIYHVTGLNTKLHSQITASSVGKWLFESFASPDISNSGTTLTPVNRYSDSTYSFLSLFYHTPTIVDEGTPRISELFGSGEQPSKFTSGSFAERLESIFGAGVEVLVKLTNESNQPQDLTVVVDFYESST